jgi:NADP-dependent 3-hydroxy acid dehydrogenase YdfG
MIIFITGATSGFGLAMATRFLHQGHHIIAVGRREDRLIELKRQFPKNLCSLKLDIRNRSEVEMAVADLPENFKKIDVLINNAGLALGIDAAQNASLDDWEIMVDTNIKGVLNSTHYILPGMIERNSGHIVNLGSVAGEFPYPGGNVYGATKAFIHQFTLNLKADLLGTNIRMTCIEPGMCHTEFSEVRFRGDKEKADLVYSGMKALSADDIADAIDWVISRPAHVNINTISLMPTQQAFGPFATSRLKK